ncbi:MAG: AraC-like DNA-binding protein [Cognaticolwellia sp.]|jgi:AraC-like DNA-binding protein
MPEKIIHQKSISQLQEGMNLGKPTHPLITIIDTAKLAYGEELVDIKITSNLYCIALKDKSCGLDYGRNHYDFEEGALMFTAPNQVIKLNKPQALGEVEGWMLYFHPDLIRNTTLGSKIDNYSFFSYVISEALHLSEQEQNTLSNCINMINDEISERIDNHSQQVLVANIELLLNYCSRYYERQFNTRSAQNKDIVSKVESLLKAYYKSDKMLEIGPPTISYLAEACFLSPSYLSDVLKKETGKTAKNHINDFLVDKAKTLLLSSTDTISRIAYTLGFNYPHYFSRLFKQKTGLTPQEYREN